MTGFFEIFNPGARHVREQRDAEKMLFIDTRTAGSGPAPLDLDSGKVTIQLPPPDAENEADAAEG